MTRIDGTTGIDRVQDGSIITEDLAPLAVTPEKMSQKLTLMTAVDLATLADKTKCDFTGIPNWAKRITVMLNGVSTNGASTLQVQLGAGAIVTSGYASSVMRWINGAGGQAFATDGLLLTAYTAASDLIRGELTLFNIGGTSWISTGISGDTGVNVGSQVGQGSITLSSSLDRIRFTTTSGTNLFDAGIVNIIYEG